MRITVKAKTSAKVEKLEHVASIYKISVKEPAVDGKANAAIIKSLSKYFKIGRSNIRLVSGKSAKLKVFEIG